ncbi:MAG: FAD-dependent oxidoreductase [Holdemanella sp.]|nr:FAD-dependent oxidoreductase [Holdemanella sp.]
MAKSGWAKYATHMSMVGGLFLGPIGENNAFTCMFKILVPEEEALLACKISNKPTSVEQVAKDAKMSVEEVRPMLEHLAQKGLLFERVTKNGKKFYNVPPFIPGFYEYVMTDPETIKNPDIAREFRRAIDDLAMLLRSVDVQGGGLMKVTPIMKEINAQQKVYSFEDVKTFINNAQRYSVADCACRTAAKLVGKGCEHPIEGTCMQFDETADYYVRTGRGHYLTKEEIMDRLEYVEKSGLVHCAFQVEGKDYTTFICNCCGCSCSGLRTINRVDANPMSHSNFRAKINEDKCVACGDCVEVCTMNAVYLGSNFSGCDKDQIYEYRKAKDTIYNKKDNHENFINERKLSAKDGTAPCKVSCPAYVSVQGYIKKASEGRYMEALKLIKETNPFPAICGRVCPHPCETYCTRNTLDQSLAIDAIKMFIADKELEEGGRYIPEKKKTYDKYVGTKVAIIGAGPAGLSAAYYLAIAGMDVTVFDKNEKPGGMLTYGIPEFRLEKDVIESEISVIKELGVHFECGVEVGKDVTIAQLRQQGYKAFYLAIGAQAGSSLNIENEDCSNVYNGVTYLMKANKKEDIQTKGKVIVVGGGNVAIDVARAAIRAGASSVDLYCLENPEEMPAAKDEQIEAKQEGVTIHNGWGPKEIHAKDGIATGITFKQCLSVRDEKGRFNPAYDESVTEDVEATMIILAIGQRIEWGSLLDNTKIQIDSGRRVEVQQYSYQTGEEDVFAGGDVVTGPRFAIDAIAAGRQGAISIERYVRGLHLTDGRNAQYKAMKTSDIRLSINSIDTTPRQFAPDVDHAKAIQTFNDLRKGLTEEQIVKEAKRCLHCGRSVVDMDKCIGCGVCVHKCSFDAIHLERVDDTQFANDMAHWYGRVGKNIVKRGIRIVSKGVQDYLKKD